MTKQIKMIINNENHQLLLLGNKNSKCYWHSVFELNKNRHIVIYIYTFRTFSPNKEDKKPGEDRTIIN